MKTNQTIKTVLLLVTAFVFFNIIVMSDTPWIDTNVNIYSHGDVDRVGIGTIFGTEDPTALLHLKDTGQTTVLKISGDGSNNARIWFSDDADTKWNIGHSVSTNQFSIYDSDAGTWPLLICPDSEDNTLVIKEGNVGIGINDPDNKLEVDGNIEIDRTDTNESSVMIRTSGQKAYLNLVDKVNGTLWRVINGIDSDEFRITNYYGSTWYRPFRIENGTPTYTLYLNDEGNVGIGTSTPDYKLEVDGTIHAEEIIVSSVSADFVFEDDYNLRSLGEVESFIEENGHLPEIPSAKEIEENGAKISEMNTKLLQKIEELTLYIIDQNKQLAEQNKRIAELEKVITGTE